MPKKQRPFVVVALDSFGAPRAWGSALTLMAATEEAHKQASAYIRDKNQVDEYPELRLFILHANNRKTDLLTTLR